MFIKMIKRNTKAKADFTDIELGSGPQPSCNSFLAPRPEREFCKRQRASLNRE